MCLFVPATFQWFISRSEESSSLSSGPLCSPPYMGGGHRCPLGSSLPPLMPFMERLLSMEQWATKYREGVEQLGLCRRSSEYKSDRRDTSTPPCLHTSDPAPRSRSGEYPPGLDKDKILSREDGRRILTLTNNLSSVDYLILLNWGQSDFLRGNGFERNILKLCRVLQ